MVSPPSDSYTTAALRSSRWTTNSKLLGIKVGVFRFAARVTSTLRSFLKLLFHQRHPRDVLNHAHM